MPIGDEEEGSKELKKENKSLYECVNVIIDEKLNEQQSLNILSERLDENNLKKTLTILKYNNELEAKLNFFSNKH